MMLKENMHLLIFTLFALGLPLWAMDHNPFQQGSVHRCSGECYQAWKQETGGVVALAAAKAEAHASGSPAELGEAAYAGCVACHGAGGEGGVGPVLSGQTAQEIYDTLVQYKNGETRGAQSALMWGQSAMLSDADMENIGAFIESL
jgi:cytochrome c553